MQDTPINQIIIVTTSLIVVVVGAFTIGMRKVIAASFDKWADRILTKKYKLGLHRVSEFMAAFDNIASLGFVERIMMLEGRNCGGIPEPGKPYMVECIRGKSIDGKANPKELYNFGIPIDSAYFAMLKRIIEEKKVVYKTSEMTESLLKDCYVSEGVFAAVIAFVGIVEGAMIFVSIANYTREFTHAELMKLDLMLMRLRSKIKGQDISND